jgi:hypothetical protein
MVRAQGGIVGWTATADKVLEALEIDNREWEKGFVCYQVKCWI